MLRYGWDKTSRHEHSHDEEVSSVGIGVDGELDGKKLNDWISKPLQTKGGDIFRMKGVLVVKGTKKRLVFQGVHMLFDAKFDRAALTEGFKTCLAWSPKLPKVGFPGPSGQAGERPGNDLGGFLHARRWPQIPVDSSPACRLFPSNHYQLAFSYPAYETPRLPRFRPALRRRAPCTDDRQLHAGGK